MNQEPRHHNEYTSRQVEAANRVLIDLGQVLASFRDSLVVVGGWAPDLLMPEADVPHVGSIDVDLALDAERLGDGRYAEMINLLLGTRRYQQSEKSFQLIARVDLEDGEEAVQVEVDFLVPKEAKMRKNRPKLLKDFRVLQVEGCGVAFHRPQKLEMEGHNVLGATNHVTLQVISIPDLLVMKAYALDGRDKPKDAYDLCYCLDHFPEGMETLANDWKGRIHDKDIHHAIEVLTKKFATVGSFGPRQVVEFHQSAYQETRDMQAQRAFQLVQKFLRLLEFQASDGA